MKIKKAIVTGGCGFIGSHLVDTLIEDGVSVTVIDKKKPRKLWKNAEAKYRKVDVQSEEAYEIVQKAKADVIFHLAAHIHDRESVREPVMNAQNNIIGTLNMLEAVRSIKKGRVIFSSTGGVMYGNQGSYPISEDAVPEPITPYAVSKLATERYLNFYHEVLGTPYIALRLSNVYGPRQDSSAESGAIGIFAAALLKGEPTFIYNDGETTRDYVYIEDAVRALIMAAESEEVGVFNIGTGKETSTNELFEMVREEIGVQAKPDNREDVVDVVKRNALDASRAKKKLGWKPEISLEEGIEKTVSWYRENV